MQKKVSNAACCAVTSRLRVLVGKEKMQYLKNWNVALFVHLAEKKCHNLCAKCSLDMLPARLDFQLFPFFFYI